MRQVLDAARLPASRKSRELQPRLVSFLALRVSDRCQMSVIQRASGAEPGASRKALMLARWGRVGQASRRGRFGKVAATAGSVDVLGQ